MYIVTIAISVKPEFITPFVAATLDNASNTRKEAGNLRFDVLRGEEDPTRFALYEVYKTKEDFAQHQLTQHYLRWKDAVAPWMARPRQGLKHEAVFYGDAAV